MAFLPGKMSGTTEEEEAEEPACRFCRSVIKLRIDDQLLIQSENTKNLVIPGLARNLSPRPAWGFRLLNLLD